MFTSGRQAQENFIRSLSPALWCRYGRGITVTGSGVSQWEDQSGNGRHLLQGTDTNRPALQTDGTILYDGVDNYLAATFAISQPCTFYALLTQVSWTSTDYIWDGATTNMGRLMQSGVSPNLVYDTDATANIALSGAAIGTYAVYSVVYNGASSSGQINNGALASGNAGAGNPGGFTLGARGGGTGALASNIRVKEVILFGAAHAANTRSLIVNYLLSI